MNASRKTTFPSRLQAGDLSSNFRRCKASAGSVCAHWSDNTVSPRRISSSFFTESLAGSRDAFPVAPGHTLIISKTLYATYFDLPPEAQRELADVIPVIRALIEETYSPDGYNIGMNCGVAAGQTVMHFHCHVIPRYYGDIEGHCGGVRYCIPSAGAY